MPEEEQNKDTNPLDIKKAVMRAFESGVIGVRTGPVVAGASIVADMALQEIYATGAAGGGKIDVGSLDGSSGVVAGYGLASAGPQYGVDHGNINGVRFSDSDAFKIQDNPVYLEVSAGVRDGTPVLRGVMTSAFALSMKSTLSYGAEASIDGKYGLRANGFAEYRRGFSDMRVAHVTARVHGQATADESQTAFSITGSLDQKFKSELSVLGHAYAKAGTDYAYAGADVGLYKDVKYGWRVGGYVGVDTRNATKAGIAIAQPFGL